MNRLESMIARLLTQRAYIDAAARRVAHLEGPVLEIGLGKGRTYCHLRQILPDREIFAFDRVLHASPDATPPDGYLLLGDFRDTLETMASQSTQPAVLAHADIGSEDRLADAALARDIAGHIVELMAVDAVVLCDRALPDPQLRELSPPTVDLPADIAPWPYFSYRVAKS